MVASDGSRAQKAAVVWAADNIAVQNVDTTSSPCSEAVATLNWARADKHAQVVLWRLWAKLCTQS